MRGGLQALSRTLAAASVVMQIELVNDGPVTIVLDV